MNDSPKLSKESLFTSSFHEYYRILPEYIDTLAENQNLDLSENEFLMLLRPYFWYSHRPAFKDLYSLCETVMLILKNRNEILFDKQLNPVKGNDFLALGTLLAGYLDEGVFDDSGFKIRYSSAELAASVIAERFQKKLSMHEDCLEDAEKLAELVSVFKEIEAAKHLSYQILTYCGANHLNELKLALQFPADDQILVLSSLEAFTGNPKVIGFVDALKENSKENRVVIEADKVLSHLRSNQERRTNA